MDHDSPRLPSSLEKQIKHLNLTDVYDEVNIDVYKYEDQYANDESMKNNHYDHVSLNDHIRYEPINVTIHIKIRCVLECLSFI
jgi:hypothetical protein